jgi:RHS repeat-associated protein
MTIPLTDPFLSGTITYAYEEPGIGPRWMTDEMGRYSVWYYDCRQHVLAEYYSGSGHSFYSSYNAAGDRTVIQDYQGHQTFFGYDAYGRLTSKTDANGTQVLGGSYDANGRLTNRWTLAKGDTRYAYDALGKLTNVAYASSPGIAFAYDAESRLTNMVDGVGTTRYGYDVSGLLAYEDGPWDNDTVSYTPTANRLRARLEIQQPGGASWAQTYGYNAGNRLASLTSPAGTFGYTYNGAGAQVKQLNYPNGSALTNAFDTAGRLLSRFLRGSGGTALDSNQYIYWSGNFTYQQTRNSGCYRNFYNSNRAGEDLDAAYAAEPSGTQRAFENVEYWYDTIDNASSRTRCGLSTTLNVNNLNQLTSATRSAYPLAVIGTVSDTNATVTVNGQAATMWSENTFTSSQSLADGVNTFTAIAQDAYGRRATNTVTANMPFTVSYQYDANGNLTSDGQRLFYYDDENQLTNVTVANAWKSEFAYDGKQRRRIRREYCWSSAIGNWQLTNEVRYVYDGNLVIQERNYLNIPTVTYTRGIDLRGSFEGSGGIGGLLARTDPVALFSPSLYYCDDGRGNVTSLVNERQAVVARYVYDPYGGLVSASGPSADANPYRFSSKEFHANSGLYYYGYRYYEPNLQRWITRDPIGEQGGVNLYAFCGNDPVNRYDPVGLMQSVGALPAEILAEVKAGVSLAQIAADYGVALQYVAGIAAVWMASQAAQTWVDQLAVARSWNQTDVPDPCKDNKNFNDVAKQFQDIINGPNGIYRPLHTSTAVIGDGGAIDAAIWEASHPGLTVGGKLHGQKIIDVRNKLQHMLNRVNQPNSTFPQICQDRLRPMIEGLQNKIDDALRQIDAIKNPPK